MSEKGMVPWRAVWRVYLKGQRMAHLMAEWRVFLKEQRMDMLRAAQRVCLKEDEALLEYVDPMWV